MNGLHWAIQLKINFYFAMLKQNWIVILIVGGLSLLIFSEIIDAVKKPEQKIPESKQEGWVAPSLYLDRSVKGKERELIIYGEDLIANTSKYLGPKGSVAAVTNGMNCQNCHLNAGRKSWGNNYGAVAANYPKFRDRSGSIETVYKRVSVCVGEKAVVYSAGVETHGVNPKAIATMKEDGIDISHHTSNNVSEYKTLNSNTSSPYATMPKNNVPISHPMPKNSIIISPIQQRRAGPKSIFNRNLPE
jgi:hypothetical protein